MGIEILLYIIIGGFAGMLAGLLGVGGGLIIVPCLVFIYTYLGFNEGVLVHIAIGTSLASIIFTGTSSAYAHYIKDSVDTKILIPVTTGIVIGAFIGAVIADHINGNDLRKIIGAFALIIAIQMYFNVEKYSLSTKPRNFVSVAVGGFIGSASSILGIGGGSFSVPYFRMSGLKLKTAIGTSAACGISIAVFGALGFLISGIDEQGLPQSSIGYIHLPSLFFISISSIFFARIGANTAHAISDHVLKIIFVLLMVIISFYMLFL